MGEPAEPVAELVEPAAEPAEPVAEPTEPAGEPAEAKSSEQAVDSSDIEKVAPSEPTVEPVDAIEPVKPVGKPAEPVGEPAEPVGEPAEPKSTISIPSISGLTSKIKEKPNEAGEDNDSTTYDAPSQSEPFTKEELDIQWKEYAQQQKTNGKDQAYITLLEPYSLNENIITITLSNDVLKITFDKIKTDLQGYLRKALKNQLIGIEAIVKEMAKEDMIYTNKEKFNHLIKNYPALGELKDKLGLDPDY